MAARKGTRSLQAKASQSKSIRCPVMDTDEPESSSPPEQRSPVLRLTRLTLKTGRVATVITAGSNSGSNKSAFESEMDPIHVPLDFVGHCPICLKRLNIDNGCDDGEGDDDCDNHPITPSNISLNSSRKIWQYLHLAETKSAQQSFQPPPKFSFKTEGERGPPAYIPTLCGTCYGEVLKLSRLHEELQAIERTLKSQVKTIQKIVASSTRRRMKFEKVLASSTDRKGRKTASGVGHFLQYIRGEVLARASLGEELGKTSSLSRRNIRSSSRFPPAVEIVNSPVSVDDDDIGDDSGLNYHPDPDPDVNSQVKDEVSYENEFDNSDAVFEAASSATDSDLANSDYDGYLNDENGSDSDWGDGDDNANKGSNRRLFLKKSSKSSESTPNVTDFESSDYKCSDCRMGFCKMYGLRRHFLRKHWNGRKEDLNESVKCDTCEKTFNRATIQCHQRFENCGLQKARHPCQICQKEFSNRGSLKQHMKSHREKEKTRPVCEVCGKDFTCLKGLHRHASKHTGEQRYSCEHCGERFRLRVILREHRQRVHGNLCGTVKKYACDLCGKAFYKARDLTEHMRIHTGEKPFVCEQCGRRFRTQRNMVSHLKQIHLNHELSVKHDPRLRPFSCTVCDKKFRTMKDLKRHNSDVHSNRTRLTCGECGLGLTSRYELRDHQNKFHIKRVDMPGGGDSVNVEESASSVEPTTNVEVVIISPGPNCTSETVTA